MSLAYEPEYPSISDLKNKARRRIPKFAFEYLDGGCNENVNLHRNTSEIHDIQLRPKYLEKYAGSEMKTKLFGHEYDAPFGVSPIGLQGLIWPKAGEILAKAAFDHNIPFILSTVGTTSIEKVSELTEGRAWFQLYHPTEDSLRDDILGRVKAAECPVLVLLCDVPTFGFRPWDIRNGLSMPPRMTIKNIMNILARPNWALQTLRHGKPQFENLTPYMDKGMDMAELGKFMDRTFSGRLNEEKIKPIRDIWKGKMVLKGVSTVEDTKRAIELGMDGIIVSNHGGRQLDAGESSINSLIPIAKKYSDKLTIMMDGGIRSGPDVARVMASGADFTFMGRPFMYGTAALGSKGGDHTIGMLKAQLLQVMEQICCEKTSDFSKHLVN